MEALAKNRLGVWPVVFTILAAAAPMTVVAGGAVAGYAVTGVTGFALGYVVVALLLGVFSIGYVAMSRKIVNAGALYTYITRGLGRPIGVAAAFVAVVGYNTMQTGLYGGFGVVLGKFMTHEFHLTAPWWQWAVIGWLATALLGGRRIDLNSKVLAVLLIGEVVVALVLAAVEVAHPAGGTVSFATLQPSNLIGPGAGAVLATAIAGFVGFEGGPVFSEESKDPQKTVRRATFIALGIIGALYAFGAWAPSVATGPDKIVARAQADLSDLFFNLAAPYVPSAFIVLGHLLFITSLWAAILAFHNLAARLFFALGREGVFSPRLGRTRPKTKAPLAGSVTQSVIGLSVILLFAKASSDDAYTYLFFWLTVLGGLGVLFLMTGGSVGVAAFFSHRRNRAGTGVGRGIIAPAFAAIGLGAVAWVTLDQFATLLGVDPTSSAAWELPSVYAAAAVAGLAWALILRQFRPEVYIRIGLGAHAVDPDTNALLEEAGQR